jgi:hypothetical protein
MTEPLSYADIEKEFEESLGYIHNDIEWLQKNDSKLNYTVALLVGCACEALADAGASTSKERILAEVLPAGDWQQLAKPLFDALRNGLAHSFDTKHLHVGAAEIQIHISWTKKDVVSIVKTQNGLGLLIGIQPIADLIRGKINDFKQVLRTDEAARRRFRAAMRRDRTVSCPIDVWKRLAEG